MGGAAGRYQCNILAIKPKCACFQHVHAATVLGPNSGAFFGGAPPGGVYFITLIIAGWVGLAASAMESVLTDFGAVPAPAHGSAMLSATAKRRALTRL